MKDAIEHQAQPHSPELLQDDPLLAKAVELQANLEEIARTRGFPSYAEMQRRLTEEREELEPESKYQLVKNLAPVLQEAETVQSPLPTVDSTGLVAIQDIARSIARLIRVLLLGYTSEEIEELADRMNAERARDIDSVASRDRAEVNHRATLQRLHAVVRSTAPSMAP